MDRDKRRKELRQMSSHDLIYLILDLEEIKEVDICDKCGNEIVLNELHHTLNMNEQFYDGEAITVERSEELAIYCLKCSPFKIKE